MKLTPTSEARYGCAAGVSIFLIGPRACKSDIPVEDPRTRVVSYETDNCVLANATNADNVPSNRVLEIVSIRVGTLDHAECMLNVTSAQEGFEKDIAHPMEMEWVLVEEFCIER
jgi:hypothetical protein